MLTHEEMLGVVATESAEGIHAAKQSAPPRPMLDADGEAIHMGLASDGPRSVCSHSMRCATVLGAFKRIYQEKESELNARLAEREKELATAELVAQTAKAKWAEYQEQVVKSNKEISALTARNAALEKAAGEMKKTLQELEVGAANYTCVYCREKPDHGHHPQCKIWDALSTTAGADYVHRSELDEAKKREAELQAENGKLKSALTLAHSWMGDGGGKDANPISFTEDIMFVESFIPPKIKPETV